MSARSRPAAAGAPGPRDGAPGPEGRRVGASRPGEARRGSPERASRLAGSARREPPGADASGRRLCTAAVAALVLLATAGCDNIVKHFDVFATMVDGPAEETYEMKPIAPPEGAVPVDGTRAYGLLEADSLLSSPLEGTAEQLREGRAGYRQFCLPCHGETGEGDGPVMNVDGQFPRRMPATPAADLTAGTGPERSEGYVWGMIQNGRGLMPSYERIPRDRRWPIVEYVEHLQRLAAGDTTAADRALLEGGSP